MDVRINGKSIVQDGVAEIPVAGDKGNSNIVRTGMVYIPKGYGLEFQYNTNNLIIRNPMEEEIGRRNETWQANYYALTLKRIDYAVKCAMCDGKGVAWTADEQAAARERMGVADLKMVVSATLEEESTINITLDKDGNIFDYDVVYINLIATKTSENISSNIMVGNSVFYVSSITNASYNTNYFCIHAKIMNGMGFLEAVSHTNSDGNLGQVRRSFQKQNIGKIDKFVTYKPFPAGTQIIIYAR